MASTDKDLNLKLAVSALFRALGYTVFQEVDLCTYCYQPKYARKQVTDFDVLGVHIDADFDVALAVAECKSLEERAMENLLKLNGVKQFFAADKAYFVQKKIDLNAREIGRELGIWVLDERNLAKLMAGVGVAQKPHVDLEKLVYEARSKAMSRQKEDLSKITDYLRYDFWTLPEHRNIINLIRLSQQASKHLDAAIEAHVIWVHQVATNLALAIIRLTGEVARHNIDDLQDGVLTRILGGPRERRDREALFDTVAKLVPDSRLTALPPYLDALVEMVARFINASSSAARVVACLDHLTRRLLVPGVDDIYGNPEEVYGTRSLKLARDVLYFLTAQAGIGRELVETSLTDQTQPVEPSTPT